MTYQANGPATAAPSPRPTRARLMQSLAALLVAGTAGLLAPACADNESSLFIRGCKAYDNEDCSVDNDASGEYFFSGKLDVAVVSSYSCPLLVGNQVVARGSSDQVRSETSRVSLYSADVRITDAAGNALSYPDGAEVAYSIAISGFVDPSDTADSIDYGIADVTLIDQATAESLAGSLAPGASTDVIASVIIYGRTLGGQEVQTGEFQFPITVCRGCQCALPTDDTGADSSGVFLTCGRSDYPYACVDTTSDQAQAQCCSTFVGAAP